MGFADGNIEWNFLYIYSDLLDLTRSSYEKCNEMNGML
jgi:hypothetical protein